MIHRLLSLYNPATDPLHAFVNNYPYEYRLASYTLWGLAIAFTVGDILTTWLAVTPVFGGPYEPFHEAIPFTRWTLAQFGPWILVPKKGVALAFIGLAWRLFPKPYQLLFPAMAATGNYLITVHNLALLIEYGVLQLPIL